MNSPTGFPRRPPSLSCMKIVCFSSCSFSSTCVSYLVFHSFSDDVRNESVIGGKKNCGGSFKRLNVFKLIFKLILICTSIRIISTFAVNTVESLLQFTHGAPQTGHRLLQHFSANRRHDDAVRTSPEMTC